MSLMRTLALLSTPPFLMAPPPGIAPAGITARTETAQPQQAGNVGWNTAGQAAWKPSPAQEDVKMEGKEEG